MLELKPSQNPVWDSNPHGWDMNPAKTQGTWFQDLIKLRFLMSHLRKNSVRDKVISKKWIYSDSERSLCIIIRLVSTLPQPRSSTGPWPRFSSVLRGASRYHRRCSQQVLGICCPFPPPAQLFCTYISQLSSLDEHPSFTVQISSFPFPGKDNGAFD